jgi:hypothetical protein
VNLLDSAEHGRMRGLIDLGITTAKYTDAQGNLILSSHSVAQAMAEVDAKTKGGRDTLTDLQKDSNTLSNDFQDLSVKGGPVLLTGLDAVVKATTAIYDEFDKIGKDNKLWSQISDRLVNMAAGVRQALLALGIAQPSGPSHDVPAGSYSKSVGFLGGKYVATGILPSDAYVDVFTGQVLNKATGKAEPPGRAGGGSVLPNSVYTVGEKGPETLVMGARGGTVIPNGGGAGGAGSTTNVYVNNPRADAWQIGNELRWVMRTRRV